MFSQLKWSLGSWAYEWNANGSLKKVQRPDGSVISFKYDAFGRRIEKKNARATTHFVWDGNVPLHEWKTFDYKEITDNDYITWVFKDFVPVAKLQGGKSYSVISDHLGTPILAIDTNGVKVWERELDIYGKVRKLQGDKWFIPFLYQGQYYDNEVDLCYNRFRYYHPNSGNYISQDPIRLAGNNPTLYGYVFDGNTEVDVFGLNKKYSCINKKNKKENKKLLDDLDKGIYRMAVYTNDANRGALLPKIRNGKKITYTEHDVKEIPNKNNGANRGVKRLVKGSDGRVYYTNSHYKDFIRIK